MHNVQHTRNTRTQHTHTSALTVSSSIYKGDDNRDHDANNNDNRGSEIESWSVTTRWRNWQQQQQPQQRTAQICTGAPRDWSRVIRQRMRRRNGIRQRMRRRNGIRRTRQRNGIRRRQRTPGAAGQDPPRQSFCGGNQCDDQTLLIASGICSRRWGPRRQAWKCIWWWQCSYLQLVINLQ